jgi:hypothetical protein
MRKSIYWLALASAVMIAVGVQNAMAEWTTFVIRNASDGSSPGINDVVEAGAPAKEFVINKANMKAGWGTDRMNGIRIGSLETVSIDRLDDTTRFTAGSGPAVGPYINLWVTDGSGRFAVIANEPSNAEWQPGNKQWDMTWDILKTKSLKVYENSDKSWLPNSGVGLTFDGVKDYLIQAPTPAQLTAGWAGLGTGAPRELGTNKAYGFNWVFGDTQSNYVSGGDGYIVANPTALPEPGAIMLLTAAGLGLLCYTWRRRRS